VILGAAGAAARACGRMIGDPLTNLENFKMFRRVCSVRLELVRLLMGFESPFSGAAAPV
jgi:hypothetical protein